MKDLLIPIAILAGWFVLSNSRPKGPLGLKRDDEAIWGNLPKTRTNRRRIALPVVRSPALGDADVYEGRFGATLYLQAICGDRELLVRAECVGVADTFENVR